MAKKGFERETVLDNAILLFWQQGFTASSMLQIVQATGLKPGSLYHEFDNKEGLFLASLTRYSERTMGSIRETIEQSDSVTKGIRQILARLIEDTLDKQYCGCFLIKTQLELAAQNNELYQLASKKLADTEDLYGQYLGSQFDPVIAKQYAKQLMMVIFGIRVYGYQGRDKNELTLSVQQLLPWLYPNH